MNDRKLKITRKIDDNYKVFSIRLRKDIIKELDRISKKTNRSRNELINTMCEFGIEILNSIKFATQPHYHTISLLFDTLVRLVFVARNFKPIWFPIGSINPLTVYSSVH